MFGFNSPRHKNMNDLIETFKILSGYCTIHSSKLFFEFDEDGKRGHSEKLFRKKSKLDVMVCV